MLKIQQKNKNYDNGANFERRIVKYFQAMNFIASRSAGSHGLFDVTAFDGQTLWVIQGKLGASERAMSELADELALGLKEKFKKIAYPIVVVVANGIKKGQLQGAQRLLYPADKKKHDK